jgi:hypothetical protein
MQHLDDVPGTVITLQVVELRHHNAAVTWGPAAPAALTKVACKSVNDCTKCAKDAEWADAEGGGMLTELLMT